MECRNWYLVLGVEDFKLPVRWLSSWLYCLICLITELALSISPRTVGGGFYDIDETEGPPQHIDNELEIPFDQSLARATLTCQLPQSNISMAMSGSNHQLSIAHQLYAMMNHRASPNVQGSTTLNNHQNNGQHQRGNQNNGNNGNGNGNKNRRDNSNNDNRDNSNNDNRRPPTDNSRNDRPIGGIMTNLQKLQLKAYGFL